MYQYFVQIVPTRIVTTFSALETYQYAYTEKVSIWAGEENFFYC